MHFYLVGPSMLFLFTYVTVLIQLDHNANWHLMIKSVNTLRLFSIICVYCICLQAVKCIRYQQAHISNMYSNPPPYLQPSSGNTLVGTLDLKVTVFTTGIKFKIYSKKGYQVHQIESSARNERSSKVLHYVRVYIKMSVRNYFDSVNIWFLLHILTTVFSLKPLFSLVSKYFVASFFFLSTFTRFDWNSRYTIIHQCRTRRFAPKICILH